MEKIRAAVCREYNAPLQIEEVMLREPGMGEVAVDIEAVAICHSDISFWQGGFGGALPAVYGHEAAGKVIAVGEAVVGIKPGDSVCVTLIHACGHCTTCQSGKPTICETPVDNLTGSPIETPEGEPVFKAMASGAFAEKVVVDQSQICVIPDDIGKDVASLISCGVITGVGAAVFAADIEVGQDVVVIGAGGVGLNAIQGARIAGARRIVAVDMLPEKLEVAKEFGATDTVLAEGKPWAEVKKILGRGADAVLVTVGVAQVYDQAPRYLGWGGRIVMVGMPHGDKTSTYSPLIMANQGQGIVGSKMGDMVIKRDIPWIVDMYKQGRLKLDELISGRWTLEQINEAIEDTKSGAARRNVIMMK
ncbi:oxidoreductase, zinc-binding dehydrogenase family protein [Pseudooceanicola batsensis HTCC2597]|uniref:Oxidoreductase, zinc-binding dehydrogenase family protein n=1 Tax=Pseudooceanicola batsensis (strain ATCC BAA-863 / DSM 15984 / KCTC 12145 / HTCC2597) TaxID=252305 RepID=A3U295_PSEBH|nr:Zn-dependent alcohol dehydrogenase [Pseudooceanicola batsensis]EAQ01695.1 oxidoreductase, zinc-binding dehydrogenase family protein [Pseudooceanicola batsensis HTCC2597]